MLRCEGIDGCIEFKNVEVTRMFFWCLVLECGYELPAKLARKSFYPWRWRLIKWRNCSEKWKEWKLIPSAEVNETRYREVTGDCKKKPVKENIKFSKQHVLEMPNERDSPLSANGDEELRLTGNGDSESNNESDYNTRYENRQLGVTVSSIIDRLRIGSEWYRGEII